MKETKKFEVGKTYWMRSICDSNCIWNVKIIKRTAKTIMVDIDGEKETKRKKIDVYNGVEFIFPLGQFSMCPMLNADKECK